MSHNIEAQTGHPQWCKGYQKWDPIFGTWDFLVWGLILTWKGLGICVRGPSHSCVWEQVLHERSSALGSTDWKGVHFRALRSI